MEEVIEKLVTETTTDVKQEEPATTEPSTEEKGEELSKLKAENERLKKATKTLNQKLKDKEVEEPEVEQPDPTDPLATREGWLRKIEEVAEEKTNKKFAVIRESNLRRARDRFLSSKPEYKDSAKLRSVLEKAQSFGLANKTDEDEMYECMLDAWAVENRKELEGAAEERFKAKTRAQKAASQAAGVSEVSEKVQDDFSDEERAEAAKHGMSVERFRKAASMLAESNLEIN